MDHSVCVPHLIHGLVFPALSKYMYSSDNVSVHDTQTARYQALQVMTDWQNARQLSTAAKLESTDGP